MISKGSYGKIQLCRIRNKSHLKYIIIYFCNILHCYINYRLVIQTTHQLANVVIVNVVLHILILSTDQSPVFFIIAVRSYRSSYQRNSLLLLTHFTLGRLACPEMKGDREKKRERTHALHLREHPRFSGHCLG